MLPSRDGLLLHQKFFELFFPLAFEGCGWWGDEDGLLGFSGLVVTPVGLEKDGVDLLEVDGFGLVTDSLDEATGAEVFDGTEGSFRAADD